MKRKNPTKRFLGFLKMLTKSKKDPFCSAVITAAGSGTRMGGVSKQLLVLDHREVLLYSVDAFHSCKYIKEIVVSAKKEELEAVTALIRAQGYQKPVTVVCGGATRQESVANAFYRLSPKSRFVAIHDGARPLLRTQDVELLLMECFRHKAVSAGHPVTDSLKKVDDKGLILEDVDRSVVWAVQTPQVFSCDLYRASLAVAQRDGLTVTDDNALATHAGFTVKPVTLTGPNLKLTTPEDLIVIEAILKERRKQQ